MSKSYKYATAAASTKPGYLQAKFARIRKEQAEEAAKQAAAQAEQTAKVRTIKKGAQ